MSISGNFSIASGATSNFSKSVSGTVAHSATVTCSGDSRQGIKVQLEEYKNNGWFYITGAVVNTTGQSTSWPSGNAATSTNPVRIGVYRTGTNYGVQINVSYTLN